ncbi:MULTISPECIES: Mor transcription activator family protein [Terrisporobacter]|nr:MULTISPECIES: Mor transcription activator family protein [Terrisporobacter]
MVDIIGMDKLIELSKVYGGASIYIPMYKTLGIRERSTNIAKEFN